MKKCAVLAALLGVLVMAGCSHRQFLLITPYAPDSARAEAVTNALRARFKAEGVSNTLTVFHMDTYARPTEVWMQELAAMARMRAQAYDPDAVFLVGDDAARSIGRELVNYPWRIVFFGVKGDPRDYLFNVSLNAAGVREDVPVAPLYDLIKKLRPGARRVAVLAAAGLEGDAVVAQIQACQDPELKVAVVRRAGTLAEWTAAVSAVQAQADVLILAAYSGVLRAPYGAEGVPEAELLRTTARLNRLPDFTFWKDAVGQEGVLACVGVSPAEQADLAAQMALRSILHGADIGAIRVASVRNTFLRVSLDRAQDLGVRVPEAFVKADEPPIVPKSGWFSRFLRLFRSERKPGSLRQPEPAKVAPASESVPGASSDAPGKAAADSAAAGVAK